ncbi:MAG: biopolymer transporter ExbD [Alphaproteobacteria bacterium]|jgi:biopolymer transport protein ExbD|nr:biopolymer transporter ExbD [Alphaproteobacteria bacterium]OJU58245.1 MAG: biopolymer transporter ExbD [Alphaproteobacteria bacterium 62-8]MBN9556497.1 biopolymer transporter ExbD [Alphaproteobacteria bacterium]MBN9566125.1 biopolymer transporter ExbD [Alphaproteobacteria bacterium]MBN9571323.1 biopolymer transporter ExbD [Alphaproteobacteria bacterium]
MSMSVGPASGDDEPMVEMNTTPLIDVMLVLLIMLIITIPIQTHAVKLDMPVGTPPPPTVPPVVVELGVDFDGTPTWNGTPVTDRNVLDQYLRQAAEADPQPEIHLRPNRLAKYGAVARVLGDAQRLGVTKIGFVGQEQYMQ